MTERLYTIHQVARMLGAETREVAQWMQKSWLPFRRLPEGTVRISETNLIEFLKRQGIDIKDVLTASGDGQSSELVDVPAPPRYEQPAVVDHAPQAAARPQAPEPPALPSPTVQSDSPAIADEPATPFQVAAQAPKAEPEQEPEAAKPAETSAVGPDQTLAQIADALLRDAKARSASEIHLDADGDGLRLRMRMDGVLQERSAFKRHLPVGIAPQLLAYVKGLAGLNGGAARVVQKARFSAFVDGAAQEFDVIACPTRQGERLTLHVLDGLLGLPGLAELGLEAGDERRIRGLLAKAGAMIILAAPPRSGKSTTLRAMLAERADASRLVALAETAEGPAIPDVVQATVDPAGGFSMASAVRGFSQQGADMIATLDVPDAATCVELLNSARAGATVLSAINADDCAAALDLLWEVGLERWATAASLSAVITQRTVRRLCAECKRPVDSQEIPTQWREAIGSRGPVFAPVGCARCSKTGYSGRAGLFSILYIDGPIASLIRQGADTPVLLAATAQRGFKSLLQAGADKVAAGVTSLDELARVLPM